VAERISPHQNQNNQCKTNLLNLSEPLTSLTHATYRQRYDEFIREVIIIEADSDKSGNSFDLNELQVFRQKYGLDVILGAIYHKAILVDV
jgi:hypothetical protein